MALLQEEKKKRFFDALYDLDQLTTDEEISDDANHSSKAGKSPNPELTPSLSATRIATERPSLRAAPDIDARTSKKRIMRSALRPSMQRRSKIRRGIQLVPPADQIFNGLTFFFIPNNDVAAPRRKRIEKALQYGAEWEKVWPSSVTHAIVDSNLHMRDVFKVLGLDVIPVSNSSPAGEG